jgi:hypothetical protein
MTFNEYKTNEQEMEIDLTKDLGKSIDEHFVSLLVFQAQLKIMHWGTESYAEHKAYMKTYDSIEDSMDNLVESYQGYHGRIDFGCNCDFASFSKVQPSSWLDSMLVCLNSLRVELKESDLQNMADELIAAVSKLKYLLTLK